jgi:putative tryptophan/tyrosine transport system substrate-binding protein
LGGAAAWPVTGRAQQNERVRRIGVLMSVAADGPEGAARLAAFRQGLQQANWTDGRNVDLVIRWGAGDAERIRSYAAELVALGPDVIMASGDIVGVALRQATRTVPIVFALIADPVGVGLVESLARPGGNITGFSVYDYGLSGKWLDLLKEIAPGVKRVAVMREAGTATGTAAFAAIQAVAPTLGMELIPIGVGDAGEIERGVAAFARSTNGGLIVTGSGPAAIHRDLIVALAAKRFVVIAFDSLEKAKAWRDSPAQKEVIDLNAKSTKSRTFIAEGMPN